MTSYAHAVGAGYSVREALASLAQAYSRPSRVTSLDKPYAPMFAFSDVGNAGRFVARNAHAARWCETWQTWLIWDGSTLGTR